MPAQRLRLIMLASLTILSLAACAAPQAASAPQTGVAELDAIVAAVLSGEAAQVRGLIQYTTSRCTTAEGLGGPPKCLPGEAEGTPVEVLPFLGPEGGSVRRAEIDTFKLPKAARLYAAYEVSEAAYSDPDYPTGDYALVFAGADETQTSFTLQVRDGRIVRVDYGPGPIPHVAPQNVVRYLVSPAP